MGVLFFILNFCKCIVSTFSPPRLRKRWESTILGYEVARFRIYEQRSKVCNTHGLNFAYVLTDKMIATFSLAFTKKICSFFFLQKNVNVKPTICKKKKKSETLLGLNIYNVNVKPTMADRYIQFKMAFLFFFSISQ